MKKAAIVLSLLAWFTTALAQKQIAITIDDLPFVGNAVTESNLRREQERFLMMTQALIDHQVPATGFVITGSIEKDQGKLLEFFKEHGFQLANHTHTHKSLNQTSAAYYIADVDKADKILEPMIVGKKFFRYPYLAEGTGAKKQEVIDFLTSKGYTIAPVTVDSKDFKFNSQLFGIAYRARPSQLPALKKRYLAFIWSATERAERKAEAKGIKDPKQILLLHANLLNAHAMGDIIQMYKDKGYTFITLEEALKDGQPVVVEDSLEQ